jgi:hypothetical protein
MESKDGALLPLSSGFPPSAPRTGQVAFTTPGAPTPAASAFSHLSHLTLAVAYCYPFWCLVCPEFLDPFPLRPALPASLDGRNAVEYFTGPLPLQEHW